MSTPNQPGQRMIGDLPLIEASRFSALGDQYWWERGSFSGWTAGRQLERLQRLLYEGQKEGDVSLNVARKRQFNTSFSRIAFHEDVLPHWERYAEAKGSQDGGMQSFQIRDVVLPPAPFFVNKLMPILQKSNDSLIQLELMRCDLGGSGLACIVDFLTDNASLSTLDLSENKIDNVDDAKFLALAIWNHPELRFVNLSKCGLGGTKGVLSEVLGGAGNLETLLLDYNAIYSEGMVLVADFLAANTTMTTLSLEGNHIDEYSTWDLFTAEERVRIKEKENKADNAAVIGKALKKNTSLRQLSLQSCNGMSLPAFLDSKRATELLTCLNLSRNNIGKEGAEMIADYLARNPVLEELDLGRNSLNSGTASRIADAMKQNTNLLHLDLRSNKFNDKSVPFFADMLRDNSTLVSLNLVWNYNIRVKKGRKELIKKALCDTSSLDAIVDSNHTCQVTLCTNKGGKSYELEMRSINALEDEAQKIRYKVVLALFAMDTDLFNPRNFDNVPLELMPRLLHLVQEDVGYCGFGEGIAKKMRKRRRKGHLSRLYEIVQGWQIPLLFVRGPGELKKKRKRKRHVMSFKDDEDEDWTPRSR